MKILCGAAQRSSIAPLHGQPRPACRRGGGGDGRRKRGRGCKLVAPCRVIAGPPAWQLHRLLPGVAEVFSKGNWRSEFTIHFVCSSSDKSRPLCDMSWEVLQYTGTVILPHTPSRILVTKGNKLPYSGTLSSTLLFALQAAGITRSPEAAPHLQGFLCVICASHSTAATNILAYVP